MLECVVNVSEGRRTTVLAQLDAACGDALWDRHTDVDHHRSVFTLGGEPADCLAAVLTLAHMVERLLDLRAHVGVHPRLGTLDVVPFVALDPASEADAAHAARSTATWLSTTLALPSYLYGAVDRQRRTLPGVRAAVRRGDTRPDVGPTRPHPRAGVAVVGVRPLLVAVNVELDGDDVDAARRVARTVRERDGGLPGVRALGFTLASRAHAQVSMNLVDLARTGVEEACRAVESALAREAVGVACFELVGLVPRAERDRWSNEFVRRSGIGEDRVIETRVAKARAAMA